MLRRLPGGSGAGRVARFALVPLVIGAGLWLATSDRSSPRTTRVEATQTPADPLPGAVSTGPWDAPALPAAPAPAPGTLPVAPELLAAPPVVRDGSSNGGGAAAPAGGAGSRSDATDGGVGGGAESAGGEAPAPAPAPARSGTGNATSLADSSTGASSAPSAATGDPGGGTSEPTTTSTPTTRATTTTTTAPRPPPSAARSRDTAAEAEVVPLTNRDRTANGLGALARSSCLDAAASGFAEQMARTGVLAHNSGAGAAVLGCRPGGAWGDNVGTSKPCDTALLESEWMDSPSHRRNILTGAFTLVGVGAWTDDKGACWVQVLFSS